MFDLHDRVVLVTGASRGIGAEIAQAFYMSGARVYGVARSKSPINSFCQYEYVACDVTNKPAVQALCSRVHDEVGVIDVLVNCAGITIPLDYDAVDDSDSFELTMATNLFAPYYVSRQVIKYMLSQQSGSIINVTSIGAKLGFQNNPGYLASKGALAALTRSMAVDYGPFGIRVNNLVPGYIHTDMTKVSYMNPKLNKQRLDRTALGRWGDAKDLVGAALFLGSDASKYVTGSDLVVDGGWTIKGL